MVPPVIVKNLKTVFICIASVLTNNIYCHALDVCVSDSTAHK